jgi:cytochrome c
MARGEKERAVNEETPAKSPEEPEVDDEEWAEILRRTEELGRRTDEAMKAVFGRTFNPPTPPERPEDKGE